MNRCQICGAPSGKTHVAREMMFGLGGAFRYWECDCCGCLQLLDVPRDMNRFYPPTYYSFAQHGWLKTLIRRRWSAYALGRCSLVGWAFSRVMFPNQALVSLRRIGVLPEQSILDVGCGSGRLLLDMQHLGFFHLAGLDPFISEDLHYPGGVTIHRKELGAFTGSFDVIMLHHSFEHMAQPREVMGHLGRLLSPTGTVVLRIPVASSHAWRQFGINWVNLDAPRHLFLHTHESIRRLSTDAGLQVVRTEQEGDGGVLYGGEAYAMNIPLTDPRFPFQTPFQRLRQWSRFQTYQRRARELNLQGQADQVCYYLRRSGAQAPQ